MDPATITQFGSGSTVRCIVELTKPSGEVTTLIVPFMDKADVTWGVETPPLYYTGPGKVGPEATLKVTGQLRPLDDSGNLYTIEKKEPEK